MARDPTAIEAALVDRAHKLEDEREQFIKALTDAELMLRVSSVYAPDIVVESQISLTGEWLKEQGLATTMRNVANVIRDLLQKPRA